MASWLNHNLAIALLLAFTQGLSGATQDPPLLFANRRDVRIVDMHKPRMNTTALTKGVEDAAAIDFNYVKQEMCWIDISPQEIKCASLSGAARSRPRRIITDRMVNPVGMAIDWVTDKIYWTDIDTKRLEVASRDGRLRRVLFWQRVDRPRAIALLPSDGLMFWTDWGEKPMIERASMDGDLSSRTVFVREDIFWPNGITIDYEARVVYWTEAHRERPQISAQNVDGTGRRVVVELEAQHPFSVTMYRDTLFWTDWSTRSVHACDKHSGGEVRTVLSGGGLQPLDLHVFTRQRQPLPVPASPCTRANGGCSHLCLLASNRAGYVCSCPTGIVLQNRTHCRERPSSQILLARRTDIRAISLDTPDHTDMVLPLKGVKHAVAVDYDPVQDAVYWTDEETKKIQRSRLDGTGQQSVILSELHSPDGLAVDWVARNVLWTDSGTKRIEVARLDGTSRKVLVSEDLDEPRAIAVDPVGGHMYWSDWSERRPKIERAALDGSRRRALFDTDIKWPNGIALDLQLRMVYWCDAGKDRIEVARMDGTGRRVVLQHELPHLFSISLLGDYVYWTDWTTRCIERAHKITGADREVIVEHLPGLMGLRVASRAGTNYTNACRGDNAGCSHLCLHTPDGPVCNCPIDHELMADLKTCVVPEAFLLYTQKRFIRRISLETRQSDVIIPVRGIEEAGALDFNMRDQRIYWTDSQGKSISRAYTNGSGVQKIIQLDTEFPEGLAVDWLAGNIYWAEAMTGRIEVARLDGSSRRLLLWSSAHPRSIAVDAESGYLFWSDWSTVPSLYRALLDCTEPEQFVTSVGRSNGLTVDRATGRLFWVDIDEKRIESQLLQGEGGRDRRVVLSGLKQPYSLAVYGPHVYWTDWTDNRIQRADKETGQNVTTVRQDVEYVIDILVFHRSAAAGWSPCALHNGGCQSLCFSRPAAASQRAEHRCGCRSHYRLAKDAKSCQPPHEFLLFAQRSRLHRLVFEPGEAPDITLPVTSVRGARALSFDPNNQHLYWAENKTIRRARDDNSAQFVLIPTGNHRPDDIQVEPYSGLLFWSCTEQNTINVTRLNGSHVGVVVTGPDKPRNIALMPEIGLMVWTNLAAPARIEISRLDGSERRHLVDRQIEFPSGLAADAAARRVFWADRLKIWSTDLEGNKRVLVEGSVQEVRGLAVLGDYLYWVDPDQQLIERVNKLTGQDRSTVVSRTPGLTAITAVSRLTRQAIHAHPCYGGWLCSHLCVAVGGRPVCSCPHGLALGRDNRTCQQPPSCKPNEFACPYGDIPCIPLRWRCDGKPECVGGADERNCSECASTQFACRDGQCIDRRLACDGRPHCDDQSDELVCCSLAQYFCHLSRQCVPLRQLCDGVAHCVQGEDEAAQVCAGSVAAVDSAAPRAAGSQHALLVILAVFAVIAVVVGSFVLWWCRCRGGKPTLEPATGINGGPMAVPAKPPGPRGRQSSGRRSGRPRREQLPLSVLARPSAPPAPACSPVSSAPYDRAHVTGASSSSSGSAGTRYPLEPVNPPPSPATALHSAAASSAPAGSSHAPTLGSYRYYKLRNRPPPPTPCSTDVCDSDSATYYAYRCGSVVDSDYDSDTYGVARGAAPPPPPPPSVAAKRSSQRERRTARPAPPPPSPVVERYVV